MITLVLGGVRSGKSAVAEQIALDVAAATGSTVTYLATGADIDSERIAAHRARRPATWQTIEEARAAAKVLAERDGVVLLDSLGTWLARDVESADTGELVDAIRTRAGDTIVVSEEVGLGVHPVSEVGRLFADRLGDLNQQIAAIADRVVFAVAGRAVDVPREPARGAAAEHRAPAIPNASGFRSALAFLTIAGGSAPLGPRTVAWFAPVGLGLGLVLGIAWRGLTAIGPPLLAAALIVAVDAIATGGLHLDGLADTADGLVPPISRARRLAAMRDPATGAFGATALVVVLTVRVAALSAFSSGRPALLAAVWCAARGGAAITMCTRPYAREQGLASGLQRGGVAPLAMVAGALTLAAAVADARHALFAVVVAVATMAGVQSLAQRRIGGYTGDTLGAGIVLSETAGLVAAALL